MPTFSYQCRSCNRTFDLFRKMSENNEPTLEPCPYCSAVKVEQIITNVPLWGDPVHLGVRRLPGEWREFLRNLKKKNPNSNINDR